jgi:hypothetical protein
VRKNFPLRIDAEVIDGIRRWADDDLRSLNGQIEFLLREALRKSGRPLERMAGKDGNQTAPDNVLPAEANRSENGSSEEA